MSRTGEPQQQRLEADTGAAALQAIDWSAPWLLPWRAWGEATAQRVRLGQSQPEALNAVAASIWPAAQPLPVRFVPQTDLPPGQAYEQHIFQHAACPTREGLHDFFNGLAWLHFPRTKGKLNHLHAAELARSGVAAARGPARDALTLFDENSALLRAPDALWNALLAKDWQRVWGDLRPLWQQAHLVLFGHALLEKLVYPRKPITAHVYRTLTATDSIAELDAWVAESLSAQGLAAKPFAHLPVLGVPGWWNGNEALDFYADASVFRPPNRHGA